VAVTGQPAGERGLDRFLFENGWNFPFVENVSEFLLPPSECPGDFAGGRKVPPEALEGKGKEMGKGRKQEKGQRVDSVGGKKGDKGIWREQAHKDRQVKEEKKSAFGVSLLDAPLGREAFSPERFSVSSADEGEGRSLLGVFSVKC